MNNERIKRIEFMGPPGAGKSFLYNTLSSIIKSNPNKPVFCYDQNIHIVTKSKSKINNVYPHINKFIDLCLKSLGSSYSDPLRNLERSIWLYNSLELSKDIELNNFDAYIVFDELLCQRGHSVCITSKNFERNVVDYFKMVPKPFAAINVRCEHNVIKDRLIKRDTENIAEELSHIEKSIYLFKIAREILLSRGVIILDLDSTTNLNILAQKMNIFFMHIINRLDTTCDESNASMPLDKRYLGNNALQYEKIRTSDQQWHHEDKAVCEIIKGICPKNILDVPMGTGRFLPLYKKYKIKTTGIDISLDMLSHANSKAKSLSYPIDTQIGDIFSLPFTKESFDCVLCLRFLNWISEEDLFKILKQFRDISKKHVIISLRTNEDINTAIILENNFYVHSNKLFNRFLNSLKFEIVNDIFINNKYGGVFKIYLLKIIEH